MSLPDDAAYEEHSATSSRAAATSMRGATPGSGRYVSLSCNVRPDDAAQVGNALSLGYPFSPAWGACTGSATFWWESSPLVLARVALESGGRLLLTSSPWLWLLLLS